MTWRALPHGPLERLGENLWTVSGVMPGGKLERLMTVVRRGDGSLVLHNVLALDDARVKELESLGEPAVLVVPGAFHRWDARVYKERYPNLYVVCPAGARKRVERVVAVDAGYDGAPSDESVAFRHFAGCKEREGYLEVRASDGVSLVVNDMFCNLPKASGLRGFFMAPTGQPSVPRISRWLMASDEPGLRADLERLAGLPALRRIVVSHGKCITSDAAGALRAAAATA